MIEAAGKLQDGTPGQYVLLKIAADIAASTGDAPTALQAVEKLVERFDVAGPKLAAKTLAKAADNAVSTSQCKEVGEAALEVVDAAAQANEYEVASELCDLARSSARKTRQFALAKELGAKLDELKQRQTAYQEHQAASAVLAANPTEPAANLAAGRYECFVKGDWDRGVAKLALGGDAKLKDVAVKELRGATSAEAQAAIGDAWWEYAETQQGSVRDKLRLRAGYWYQQAEPELAGVLAGLKIKRRLAELEKLNQEVPTATEQPAASETPPLAIAPFDERTAKEHQALWAKYLKAPVVQTNCVGMTFVLIPAGEFLMGSPDSDNEAGADEKPQHPVRITEPFYLGACEVTQAQYQRVMFTNPSNFKDARGMAPVERVSWEETQEFCTRLSGLPDEQRARRHYRLPTEAEWEYACRAGTAWRFCFDESSAELSAYAWYADNSASRTHPVGQRNPNAWGLYDMHGNVWEWCEDSYDSGCYRLFRSEPAVDPSASSEASDRVIRGGCYPGRSTDCRSANRDRSVPGNRSSYYGFRLVLERLSKPKRR
ncbi:MAG: formylglycine-generating enzyme family protein [Planctomycetes bacterium]|nr:formylglycine-generating enzyme family protein [Planctomycetota bacterium]